MTTYDAVTTVLGFVRMHGPILSVAYVMGALAATLVVAFLAAKSAAPLSRGRAFDVGGDFGHFYSQAVAAARSGAVYLIYAAYVALWLSRWPASYQFPLLHEPANSVFYGVLVTLVLVGLLAKGVWELARAEWCGFRWVRLEAHGVQWHVSDSGDPYRIMWRRRDGQYFYGTDMTRDKRGAEEMLKLRERRVHLGTTIAVAVIALVVWWKGQIFVQGFYPVFSPGFVGFLQWALPTCLSLIFFFVAIPKSVGVVAALVDDATYHAGAQYIEGAKVLEADASRLGRQDVKQQKAHGDADFEAAADAVRRMFRPGKS